jgi:hypothetical protein
MTERNILLAFEAIEKLGFRWTEFGEILRAYRRL